MTISLSDTGKRFNREWIFRHFTYQFHSGTAYAITGANGSGKSTLLQVLSGSMHFNEGTADWTDTSGAVMPPEKVYSQVSICAPYLELVEEMSLLEFFRFHQVFKQWIPGLDPESVIGILGLEPARDKQIRNFSSGMKQRVKLAQCILSDTALVLLDEPCTNLDEGGIELYHRLISSYAADRLVVVSSNDPVEYRFCQHTIRIQDYR